MQLAVHFYIIHEGYAASLGSGLGRKVYHKAFPTIPSRHSREARNFRDPVTLLRTVRRKRLIGLHATQSQEMPLL